MLSNKFGMLGGCQTVVLFDKVSVCCSRTTKGNRGASDVSLPWLPVSLPSVDIFVSSTQNAFFGLPPEKD